ncbi:MAG: EcoRV family type II restriction endonuclease [Bacteroidaceae bacterium]|nr:EcoRV family type II restriction endonuclease [Bacteroidaceae bacterium]
MKKDEFISKLRSAVKSFTPFVSTKDGQWVVKGFIDVYKHIYTISTDTKVVSKIIELYIFPLLLKFAKDNELRLELTKEQNFYPDITFIDGEGNLFAVDLKSSYRKSSTRVNGMTLGAFTGYFRNRQSTKNVTYPYSSYKAHIVLGIIYSENDKAIDECKSYTIESLDRIISVVKDITFFVQEKWKIAVDRPGSGNTKNIGSVSLIKDLINGNGSFADLGEDVFDDYWTNYLTPDMAKKAELVEPYYTNLDSYKKFRNVK